MAPKLTLIGFATVASMMASAEWLLAPESKPTEVVISKSSQQFVAEQIASNGAGAIGIKSYDDALKGWINEEVLYREGMKLGLDRDDLIVKRRVVQKMRFLLEGMTPLQEPDDATLQTWLDEHAEQYQTGERYEIKHLFFSRGKRGDDALESARAALSELKRNAESTPASDPYPLRTDGVRLSMDALEKELGGPASNAIAQLSPHTWSEPVNSAMGVHLFYVKEKTAGRTMTLAQAKTRVRADLLAHQRELVNTASEAAVVSRYKVVIEP